MSITEYRIWKAYRIKSGSLFFGRRIERAVGRINSDMVSLWIRKPQKPCDFMPHEDQPKKNELSLEEYMAQTYGE